MSSGDGGLMTFFIVFMILIFGLGFIASIGFMIWHYCWKQRTTTNIVATGVNDPYSYRSARSGDSFGYARRTPWMTDATAVQRPVALSTDSSLNASSRPSQTNRIIFPGQRWVNASDRGPFSSSILVPDPTINQTKIDSTTNLPISHIDHIPNLLQKHTIPALQPSIIFIDQPLKKPADKP